MSRLTVGSIEGLTENSNVISVPTGHTLNAVDGLQIGGTAVGKWVDYSGSQTFNANLTVGNGTIQSYYAVVNDVVFWRGEFTLGSTSAVGGTIDVVAPITPIGGTGEQWPGVCRAGISSVFYPGFPLQVGVSFRMTRIQETGGTARTGDYAPTLPATWGPGDTFQWWITYQAA